MMSKLLGFFRPPAQNLETREINARTQCKPEAFRTSAWQFPDRAAHLARLSSSENDCVLPSLQESPSANEIWSDASNAEQPQSKNPSQCSFSSCAVDETLQICRFCVNELSDEWDMLELFQNNVDRELLAELLRAREGLVDTLSLMEVSLSSAPVCPQTQVIEYWRA